MLDFKHTDRTRREFESLSLDHLDALYSAGLRLTKNERDAEDLVQDTFLRAFRFFDKFERGTNMKAWLFKILTNTFINKYRRRVKERTVVEGAAREAGNERFVTREPTESSADPGAVLLRQAPLRRRDPQHRPASHRLPAGGDPRRPAGVLLQGDRRDPRLPGGHGDVAPLSRPQALAEEPARLRGGIRRGAAGSRRWRSAPRQRSRKKPTCSSSRGAREARVPEAGGDLPPRLRGRGVLRRRERRSEGAPGRLPRLQRRRPQPRELQGGDAAREPRRAPRGARRAQGRPRRGGRRRALVARLPEAHCHRQRRRLRGRRGLVPRRRALAPALPRARTGADRRRRPAARRRAAARLRRQRSAAPRSNGCRASSNSASSCRTSPAARACRACGSPTSTSTGVRWSPTPCPRATAGAFRC